MNKGQYFLTLSIKQAGQQSAFKSRMRRTIAQCFLRRKRNRGSILCLFSPPDLIQKIISTEVRIYAIEMIIFNVLLSVTFQLDEMTSTA